MTAPPPILVTELPPAPARPDEANKGTFGHVLIMAGSRGMSGAACLSGLGALRGGAGLVTVAVPAELQPIVAAVEPSFLTLGLPGNDRGQFSQGARAELAGVLSKYDVLAFGPGWGRSDDLAELALWLFTTATSPAVVDADALNAIAQTPDVLGKGAALRILTPHTGEFARLTGDTIANIQANRESLAVEFAAKHRLTLLLKGAHTVITDGKRMAINSTGNSGMATGGTGDVLTGLIAALLGQGMGGFEAAQLGAHLHGLAGDLAAVELSRPGLIATDLPRFLPRAWKQLGA